MPIEEAMAEDTGETGFRGIIMEATTITEGTMEGIPGITTGVGLPMARPSGSSSAV